MNLLHAPIKRIAEVMGDEVLQESPLRMQLSIGTKLWAEGIRVNTICPGVVKTALLTDELQSSFPGETIIPLEVVTGPMCLEEEAPLSMSIEPMPNRSS
ncbi:hypothetical protein PENSUB_10939 [Penicillium subrubescens]|uniref:Uncharacterized protein n=1 Tax=Penicillium subrubescens TaxID=1316194 RepID=A0A1Q5T6W6_9EURO|nr:hypothetical protein PENSUB_10939 [Penicillium subrubescens]